MVKRKIFLLSDIISAKIFFDAQDIPENFEIDDLIDFKSQNFEFSKQDRQHQSCELAPQTNKHVALESVEASFDQSNNNSQNFETSNVATPQDATDFTITSTSNLRSEPKTHELFDLVALEDVNQNYRQNDKQQRKREQKRLARKRHTENIGEEYRKLSKILKLSPDKTKLEILRSAINSLESNHNKDKIHQASR